MHLAALKRSMAKELRCLGHETENAPISNAKFAQCWHDFKSQNDDLRNSVSRLDAEMEQADPAFNVRHVEQRRALGDLYFEKLSIESDIIAFYKTSGGGTLFGHISINPLDAKTLASGLESEAEKLDEAANKLADLLVEPTPAILPH
jgi:hypothetical protein